MAGTAIKPVRLGWQPILFWTVAMAEIDRSIIDALYATAFREKVVTFEVVGK